MLLITMWVRPVFYVTLEVMLAMKNLLIGLNYSIWRYSMKVGLSYSRCVRDIIDGKVDYDDVLVIIARTNFDPHNDDIAPLLGHYKYITVLRKTKFIFSIKL